MSKDSLHSSRHYEDVINEMNDEPKHKKAKESCPARSGPSPERLLAHATALINKVSSFVTKPVDAKHGGKKPRDRNKLNVETASTMEGSLPVAMFDSSTPIQSTQEKSTRTIRCKICIDSFSSIKELNDHHRKDHGVVDCD